MVLFIMIASKQSHDQLAVLSLLFSAAMWGIIWYPLRELNTQGMSGLWTSLVMYSAAVTLTIPFLWQRIRRVQWHLLIGLAISAGVTNIAFVIAMIEGEVMRVMLLFYLSPFWTVLIGWWWLKERLSSKAVLWFLSAMIGALIMLWNPTIAWPWPQDYADFLAMIAGLAFAIHNVLARKLAKTDMVVKTAATWWGVMLMSGVLLLLSATTVPTVTWDIWLAAWLLGWFGIVLMTVAVLYGLARMPVYRSAVIMLSELIVAAISAWWLTEETMTMYEWLGGMVILVSAYGVARLSVNEKQKEI